MKDGHRGSTLLEPPTCEARQEPPTVAPDGPWSLADAAADPAVRDQLTRLARLSGRQLALWSVSGDLLFSTADHPPAGPGACACRAVDGGDELLGRLVVLPSAEADADVERDLLDAGSHVLSAWLRAEGEKNQLTEEILVKLRELSVLHDISDGLARAAGAAQVGAGLLEHAAQLVSADRAVFLAHDADRSETRAAATSGDWLELGRGWRPADPDSLTWRAMNAGTPLLVPELSDGDRALLRRELGPGVDGVEAALVVPACVDGEPHGAIVLCKAPGTGAFTSVDAKLVGAMAAQGAVSLRHLRLHDEAKEMFHSTVWALASAVDAKDAYTHGHSQRVARYASAVARELGFDAEEIERLELAAVLHDVGKIGVPESVLNKPGRLTPAEMSLMKTHPDRGADILSSIRAMRDVLPGVRHHHEWWDGTGYPDGLKGENIPLSARIILVADTFDAMTSTRPYRPGLPAVAAVDEIRRFAGSQFDPRVAESFARLVEEGAVRILADDWASTHGNGPDGAPS